MTDLIKTERRGDLGLIRICRPPVNALGSALRRAISTAHHSFDADPLVKTIVLTGQARFFSAGADIKEFDSGREHPYLTELIAQIEDGQKPVIALINGVAFGGGLELALGCDRIIMLPEATVAFPEIKLGNIPGAGGTQKLPRLIGGPEALNMILTGEPVTAEQALAMGLADAIAGTEAEALEQIVRSPADPRRRVRELTMSGKRSDLDDIAARHHRRSRGAMAVKAAIEAVGKTYDTPISEALEWEQATFRQLNTSSEARAQRHIFFAEREARVVTDVPAETPKRRIESAGVIGAGTMGAGIAMSLATAGIPVTLVEMAPDRLEQGLATIRRLFEAARDKGQATPAETHARIGRITGSVAMGDLAQADIVIEAVFEAMDIKQEVFASLDQICKPGAILATNTSTLDVDQIASATARPQDVIGLHFFSPAHVMRLLEVVRGEATAKDVIATAMALGQRMGKVPVLVGVCDGFAGNRMFMNFTREAQILIEEGALPWQIDKVLTDWGFAMGPLAVMDLAGLDVGYRIRQARGPVTPNPFATADRLVESGRLGQKSGRGWYLYPDGTRRGVPDPEVEAMIETLSKEKGIPRRAVSDEEILHRCLWQLVNTGFQIIDEGIVQRPGDLDVIFVNGYGFPKTRGGPVFYANQTGLDRVLADVKRNEAQIGPHWKPATLLEKLAAE